MYPLQLYRSADLPQPETEMVDDSGRSLRCLPGDQILQGGMSLDFGAVLWENGFTLVLFRRHL